MYQIKKLQNTEFIKINIYFYFTNLVVSSSYPILNYSIFFFAQMKYIELNFNFQSVLYFIKFHNFVLKMKKIIFLTLLALLAN